MRAHMILSLLQIKSLAGKAEPIHYGPSQIFYSLQSATEINAPYSAVLISGEIEIKLQENGQTYYVVLKDRGSILSSFALRGKSELRFKSKGKCEILYISTDLLKALPPTTKILFEHAGSSLIRALHIMPFKQAEQSLLQILSFLEKNIFSDNLLSSDDYIDHFLELVVNTLSLRKIGFYKLNSNRAKNELNALYNCPYKSDLYFKKTIKIKSDLKFSSQNLNLTSSESIEIKEGEIASAILAEQYSYILIPIASENGIYAFLVATDINSPLSDKASALLQKCGQYLASLHLNIDSQKNEDSDAAQAEKFHIDRLTGLKTRLLFKDRIDYSLKQSERNNKKIAIFYIGIDRFRQINTSLGYEIGDQLLRIIAQRIQSCGRSSDTVARMHGDEFAVLALVNHIDECRLIANRIISALEQSMSVQNHECYIGTSIGVSATPDSGQTVEVLLASAESAMHNAKGLTGNNYQFSSANKRGKPVDLIKMETHLHRAIEAGEIVNFYQPIIDMQTRQIIGSETLSRWVKKDGSMISPGDFIPLAEKTGLIVKMSEAMLQKACEMNVHCAKSFHSQLKTTVNVSMRWLIDENFIQCFQDVIHKTNIDPKQIVIELTEGLLLRDAEAAKRILAEIKKMDISLALDDFGTGYSSLSFLDQFEIDYIKIDQSFVAPIKSLKDHAPIIKGLLKLSEAFDIQAVAEGIETETQHEYIKKAGCKFGQGYLYARALPINDFIELVKKDSKADGTKPHAPLSM